MNNKRFVFVFLFFVLASCERRDEYYYEFSGVKTEDKVVFKRIDLSIDSSRCLFEQIDSVSLEATEESYLTEIENVFMTDSLIVVVDKNNPVPLVFDRSGRFLYQLTRLGDGPGEIKLACCTQLINDSIVGIYNSSSLAVELFDLKKKRKIDEISLHEKRVYSTGFLTPRGRYYYFFNSFTVAPLKGFVHYYDKKKDSLVYLWGMDENYIANYNNYQNLVYCHLGDCVFTSLNTDYKIHFWDKGLYRGYLTNEYHAYHFIPNDRKIEFNNQLTEYDLIKKIFILDSGLLFVVLSTKEGEPIRFKYNGKICHTRKYFERMDVYHMDKKKIYPAFINSFYAIVGVYNDQILVAKEHCPCHQEKNDFDQIKNPSILVYRLKKEIFN